MRDRKTPLPALTLATKDAVTSWMPSKGEAEAEDKGEGKDESEAECLSSDFRRLSRIAVGAIAKESGEEVAAEVDV